MFMGLGDLPGGDFWSVANGVSADGMTVVGTGNAASGSEAFRWTPGGGMQGLGDLSGGFFASQAFGVSADGQTVVGRGNGASGSEAFRWTPSGGMQGLGILPGGTFANGVSADGQTVVGGSYSPSGAEAFRWTASSGMQGLGETTGGSFIQALGVSANGQVVVGYGSGAWGYGPVRWTTDGGMQSLGMPLGGSASAVSADGLTVVGSAWFSNGGQAFRWTPDDGAQNLGIPPWTSVSTDVSADGQTVVGYGYLGAALGVELFIWDAGHGMRSFEEVLQSDYGLNLSGWTLQEATGISDDGRTIVGYGTNPNGQTEAWLARLDPIALALTPGSLPYANTFEQAAGAKQPGNFQTFTQPGSFASGSFVDGLDGFDSSKQTYVLVHGWNGTDSYLTSKEKESVPGWIVEMANGLRDRNPDANIIAWNWTQSADSRAPDTGADLLNCFSANRFVANCNIVPTREVSYQALYLTRTLESLYAGSVTLGNVQLIGHSLGAAIAGTATEHLLADGFNAPLDRLTLFDAPENLTALLIGGRVKLDATVLPDLLKYSGAPTVENYIAEGFTPALGNLTGYGTPYDDVANTDLIGHVHFSAGPTPMDWYQQTILSEGSPQNVGARGLNESTASLENRYDETWGNYVFPLIDDYYLTRNLATLAKDTGQYVLEKYTDLKQWGGEQIDKAVTGVQAVTAAIKDKTVALWDTLKDKLEGEPGSLNTMRVGDSAVFVPASAGEWSAVGEAEIVAGVGLKQVTHSPSYAFTNIHIPDNADSFILEFMPVYWASDDTYFIAFDDQILYWLDGSFFKNDWMTTGFLDIALWAGKDVLLTIGLISDEAGHEVVTGGYGFFSQERLASERVPEPATLALLLLGLIVLAYGRAQGMRSR